MKHDNFTLNCNFINVKDVVKFRTMLGYYHRKCHIESLKLLLDKINGDKETLTEEVYNARCKAVTDDIEKLQNINDNLSLTAQEKSDTEENLFIKLVAYTALNDKCAFKDYDLAVFEKLYKVIGACYAELRTEGDTFKSTSFKECKQVINDFASKFATKDNDVFTDTNIVLNSTACKTLIMGYAKKLADINGSTYGNYRLKPKNCKEVFADFIGLCGAAAQKKIVDTIVID